MYCSNELCPLLNSPQETRQGCEANHAQAQVNPRMPTRNFSLVHYQSRTVKSVFILVHTQKNSVRQNCYGSLPNSIHVVDNSIHGCYAKFVFYPYTRNKNDIETILSHETCIPLLTPKCNRWECAPKPIPTRLTKKH